MNCPNCHSSLREHKFEHAYQVGYVDICLKCRGIWFDIGEIKKYSDYLIHSEKIESLVNTQNKTVIGDVHIKEPEKVCPKCRAVMKPVNFAYDSNIILDRCSFCEGLWADNNEALQVACFFKGDPELQELGRLIAQEMDEAEKLVKGEMPSRGPLSFLPFAIGDKSISEKFPKAIAGITLINLTIFMYLIFSVPGSMDVWSNFFKEWGNDTEAGSDILIPFLVGYLFVYDSPLHILLNTFYLWIFGDNLEEMIGWKKFLSLYIIFSVIGGLLSIAYYGKLSLSVIGAGGAVAAVMGASLLLFPYSVIKVYFLVVRSDIPASIFIIVWGIICFFFGLGFYNHPGTVPWFALFGCFIIGFTFTWYYKKVNSPNRTKSLLPPEYSQGLN